ncbi:peptidase S08 family protein [Oscillibacter valericigenes Sjm18-20]|nr:peptidase S08 family protein [Oscillibacter valericigenes Sjm18-20]
MNEEQLQEFINSPDTVDFIVRGSDDLDVFLKENPNVIATQTLAGRYVVCYANVNDFATIINRLGTSYVSSLSIVLGLLDRPALETSGIIGIQRQPYLELRGQGVLVGIVDTGIDYTQQVFRYEDGTSKIRAIYDQSLPGTPPQGFFIGTEYSNEQINEALQSEAPYEIVPQRDTDGHGTFLASVAAGRETGSFLGAAPDAELVVVKLRKARPFYLDLFAVPETQENAFGSTAVMIGVEYILKKAQELNRPVVICLGIGTNSGSHDGFSIFEEYLSEVSNLVGVCLCIAAGNESQARHHTQGKISARGESRNIDISVENESSVVYAAIWSSISDRISVSVRSPTGELAARLPPKSGNIIFTNFIFEQAVVRVAYYYPLEGSGGQLTIVQVRNATPGIWTITVYGDLVLDGTFHAWLPLTGLAYPGVEFLAANPNYTVTVPSTAVGAISCGGYNIADNSLYPNSSWGPTRINLMAPDLVAPGVSVGGIFPTGYGTMSGTSVAAAVTAGACALMLQWGIVQGNDTGLSTYQIRAYLIRGCRRNPMMSYPNTQWGYGALDLVQTFNFMRETR